MLVLIYMNETGCLPEIMGNPISGHSRLREQLLTRAFHYKV